MKKLIINPNNKRYYSDEYVKGWEDGVKAQYEATIDAVQAWIPCSERLPKDLDPVNATWVNHNPPCYYMDIMNVPFTGTCVRYKGKWYWWDATVIDLLGEYGGSIINEPIDKDIEVTAWMPLPKPYKGGDSE